MLEHAWLIPLIPALVFWAILAMGKRMPDKGAWLGIGGVLASFVISVVAAA
ncbi:MAG: hypothetical protein ACRD0D_05745 [Acidimicrobiales bacterium]